MTSKHLMFKVDCVMIVGVVASAAGMLLPATSGPKVLLTARLFANGMELVSLAVLTIVSMPLAFVMPQLQAASMG